MHNARMRFFALGLDQKNPLITLYQFIRIYVTFGNTQFDTHKNLRVI